MAETVRLVRGPGSQSTKAEGGEPTTWWARYQLALKSTGLTETAQRVVDLDSEYVVRHGVLQAGQESTLWPVTRLRRGLVMGAVQSGKTAALMAVLAKALDEGVNVVVVLAGTRIALWRQTYARLVDQLDGWTIEEDEERRAARLLLPSPRVIAESNELPGLEDLYFEPPSLVRKMLLRGKPLVAVVMKNEAHLMRFSRFLHGALRSAFDRSSEPLHMLVVDDEADDGSILDRNVETGMAPDSDGLKQLPRHVARLWSASSAGHQTFDPRLFATYLAYTATPQSNFLQSDHNPLCPTDIVAALRVSYDTGSVEPPRSTTFAEPQGIGNYYTGGEIYYRRVGEPGALCVVKPFPDRQGFPSPAAFENAVRLARADLLSESLRAYFVSGAISLLLSGRRLGLARGKAPDSEDAILQITPSPNSMLCHLTSSISGHFLAAREVAAWSAAFDPTDTATASTAATAQLYPNGLRARLEAEDPAWKSWLRSYEQTRAQLSFLPGGAVLPNVDETRWSEVREILINDVFLHTRLAVINSDPGADDRPEFLPEKTGVGFIAPRDIFTIFVSGDVMARGITLEGLGTSLFLRSANEPLADSQMQMQRWFGYRGRQLARCRLFTFRDQLDLFRGYHEGDEAVRREILHEMNVNPGAAPQPLILQGVGFKATGKIANLLALPLCPGPDPFVRVIENGTFAARNAGVLVTLLEEEPWKDMTVGGTLRGRLMTRQLDLIAVACLLEGFRYNHHNPSATGVNHDRWRSLSSELGIDAPEGPLFRPPFEIPSGPEAVGPRSCPYSIAAYLRLWAAVLTRHARGLFPTDDPRTPWSMLNLTAYSATAPRFYIGIRYGSAGSCSDPRLRAHGLLRMDRGSSEGLLSSTWGSRNPGEGEGAYLGDQLFDYHVNELTPPTQIPGEPLWRPRGAPGLLLFHVIRGPGGSDDAVTVGLALPAGGPDHIAALRSRSSRA